MKSQYQIIKRTKTKVYKDKTVFVGLSGGVDSAVSAALLKEQGYRVVGVFIKIWKPEWMECPMKDDRLSAMQVCARLQIPFLELDLTREYEKEVIRNMIDEYKTGRTPNPDVICNREIKFGRFFNWSFEHGADFVATGHYAKIIERFSENKRLLFELGISKDQKKDQTYFLWTLSQKHLSKTLFPVGEYTKDEVRQLAKKFNLPNAQRKDSQGLCFVGKLDIKDFLAKYIKPRKGKVVNEYGEQIGEHNGVEFFTIGERHGFTITEKTPNNLPYFVFGKDLKKNILLVSHKRPDQALSQPIKAVIIKDVNWISSESLFFQNTKSIYARIRYRQPLQELVAIEKLNINSKNKFGENWRIIFKDPQIIAPGQSLVLYKKDLCLGGGVIEKADLML